MEKYILNEKNSKKDLRDKKLARKLCQQLDMDFFNVLGFDPEFKFLGGLKEDSLNIYAWHTSDSLCNKRIEFHFHIHYPQRDDVITEEELGILSDIEYFEVTDGRRELTYVSIDYVGVNPQRQGVGTLLVNSFIKRIKNIEGVKKIILMPQDYDASMFWSSVGFRHLNSDDLKTGMFSVFTTIRSMIYDLDRNK